MGNIPKYASCICNKQQDKGEMDLNKDKEELLKKFEEKKNHSFDFHQHEYPNQTSFLDFNNSNTNNYDNEIVNYIYLKEKTKENLIEDYLKIKESEKCIS